jgi:hypothetical protein
MPKKTIVKMITDCQGAEMIQSEDAGLVFLDCFLLIRPDNRRPDIWHTRAKW